jgi:hypothetical protein
MDQFLGGIRKLHSPPLMFGNTARRTSLERKYLEVLRRLIKNLFSICISAILKLTEESYATMPFSE